MKNRYLSTLAGLCLLPLSHAGAAELRPDGAPADWPEPVNDARIHNFLQIDRLEYQEATDESAVFLWDTQGWVGGDYNRLWVKFEGEDSVSGESGGEAEVQALYSRFIAPFWDLQVGARFDQEYGPGPDPSRAFGVIGVQGLAPYWFEVETALYVSEDGDVSADLEAEYELLFTQRLVLQPRFKTNIAAQKVEEFGIGSGFTDVELGLRLRYEIKREFAPYVGVSWKSKLGNTADIARAEGEDVDDFAVVAGLRVWF